MNYYVIKELGSVSQAQINASNSRSLLEARKNQHASKCVLEFDDSGKQYFMDDKWLTKAEVDVIMTQDEWVISDDEQPGFWAAVKAFFGL